VEAFLFVFSLLRGIYNPLDSHPFSEFPSERFLIISVLPPLLIRLDLLGVRLHPPLWQGRVPDFRFHGALLWMPLSSFLFRPLFSIRCIPHRSRILLPSAAAKQISLTDFLIFLLFPLFQRRVVKDGLRFFHSVRRT